VQAGMVQVDGNAQSFAAVVANIMNFDPVFNIVTP
jgi:alkyl sulfatase BDS1-like metallo-beta-lactamase superfamily hydrolase